MQHVEYGAHNSQTIILLHGGGLSWWNYREVAQLLEDKYHVVLPILDGHADSDAPFTSIEDNAARIIAHIDQHVGGKVLAICGLSILESPRCCLMIITGIPARSAKKI